MQPVKLNFTQEQKGAKTSAHTPAIIEAGAGSGKTTMLVERFLDYLHNDSNLSPKNILLITFTENAVLDLKSKILKNNVYESSIYTFHGFFNLLISENPQIFGLDPSFKIIDDTEVTTLYNTLCDSFLLNIKKDDSPLLKSLLINAGIDQIKQLLLSLYHKRYYFEVYANEDALINFYSDLNLEKLVNNHFQDICNSVEYQNNLKILLNISSLKQEDKIFEVRCLLLPFLQNPDFSGLFKVLPFPSLKGGSQKNYDSPETFQLLKDTISYFKDLFKPFNEDLLSPEKNAVSFEYTKNLISLFKLFKTHIDNFKQEKNLADFADLELLVLAKSTNKDIFDFCNTNYSYILIDEFQDTSQIQKAIIKNIFNLKKLTIVGDPKQSIYKFRNADLKVFNELSKDITAFNPKLFLTTNFRSHKNLINFSNYLFSKLFAFQNNNEVLYHPLKPSEKEFSGGNIKIIAYEESNEWQLIVQEINKLLFNGYNYKDICILLHSNTHLHELEDALKLAKLPYYTYDSSSFFKAPEILSLIYLIRVSYDPTSNYDFATFLKSYFIRKTDNELSNLLSTHKKLKLHEIFKSEKLDNFSKLIRTVPLSDFIRFATTDTVFQQNIYETINPNQAIYNIEKFIRIIQAFEADEDFINTADIIKKLSILQALEQKTSQPITVDENSNFIKIMTIHKAKGLEFKTVIIPQIHNNPSAKLENLIQSTEALSFSTPIKEESYSNVLHYINAQADKKMQAYEALRLLYVAVTRAKENLILIGEKPKKTHDLKLTSNWITQLFNTLGLDETSSSQKIALNDFILEYENIQTSPEEPQKEPCNFKTIWSPQFLKFTLAPEAALNELSAIAIQHFVKDKEYFIQRHLFNIPEDLIQKPTLKVKAATSSKNATLKGQIIHKLFERAISASVFDSHKQLLTLFPDLIDLSLINEVKTECQTFFDSTYFKELQTSEEKYVELPFVFDMKCKIRGTIDRLDIWKDHIIITDYKTSENFKLSDYQMQATIYAIAVSRLYPNRTITFNFYITPTKKTLNLPFDSTSLVSAAEQISYTINEIHTLVKHLASRN